MTCVVNGLVPDAEVLDNGGTCGVETVVTDSSVSAPVETEKSNRIIIENNNKIKMYNSLGPAYISMWQWFIASICKKIYMHLDA